MASRFSTKLRHTRGTPVETWFGAHFLAKDERTNGPHIPGIGPFNSTLLVIRDRIELNDQTSSLYTQGSPTPSGKIYGFAGAEESFIPIFKKDFEKERELRNVFCLPLICRAEDCESLWTWISDCSVNFVKGKVGNNCHDPTHIATAYSCALSTICYQIAESITSMSRTPVKTEEPVEIQEILFPGTAMRELEVELDAQNKADILIGDAERMMLYDAFHWIVISIQSLIAHSDEIRSVFQTLCMAYQTPDTLQSINASFLLDSEFCTPAMRANWIYLSYMRYLRYSATQSFATDFPIGLTALMVVAPMISYFASTANQTSWSARIGQIMSTIESAMMKVYLDSEAGDIATDYDLRVAIMEAYCVMSPCPLIDAELVPLICASVEGERSIDSVIRPHRLKAMIESTPMINGKNISNRPYVLDLYDMSDVDPYLQITKIIGSNSSDWTAICLRPGTTANVRIHSLGCTEKKGNTSGKGRIQNVRFSSCFDPQRMDIMKGQKGVSTSGQVYYPGMNRFKRHIQPHKIRSDRNFTVESTVDSLTIMCSDNVILRNIQSHCAVDGPFYSNAERFPLIAFKNCYLEIEVLSFENIRRAHYDGNYPTDIDSKSFRYNPWGTSLVSSLQNSGMSSLQQETQTSHSRVTTSDLDESLRERSVIQSNYGMYGAYRNRLGDEGW
jgi:hypothetical protein